jgi:transcriptional regulator of acetoin/glycerol metabolism
LEVIKSRDGDFQTEDKELVASLLNTSVRTIERIWRKAQDQLEQGQPVDVSNKKKGNSGRKRKDLELSRMKTIPLNKRRTIRSLAKALGVNRSTLHRRFKWFK